jgi:hypothetical protein
LVLILDNDTFYLQYSADADVNNSVTGSLENTDEVELKMNFNSFFYYAFFRLLTH